MTFASHVLSLTSSSNSNAAKNLTLLAGGFRHRMANRFAERGNRHATSHARINRNYKIHGRPPLLAGCMVALRKERQMVELLSTRMECGAN